MCVRRSRVRLRLRVCGSTAAIATAAALALAACGGDAAETAAPVRTTDPAATFAPLVHLHSRELWWPIGALDFIDFAILMWRNGTCAIDEEVAIGRSRNEFHVFPVPIVDPRRLGQRSPYAVRPLVSVCAGRRRMERYSTTQSTRPHGRGHPAGMSASEGFHLDVATALRAGRRRVSREDGQTFLDGVPVYVDSRPEQVDGHPGLRLSYWMLFGFERPMPERRGIAVEHEGDWERVDVLLRRGERRHVYVPVAVGLGVRGERRDIPWGDMRLAAGARPRPTHPVVFAARGSHELYSHAGRYGARVPGPGGSLDVDDVAVACPSCPAWRTWRVVRPLRAEPWWGYRGAWGQAGDGPLATGVPGPAPLPSRPLRVAGP